MTIKTLAAAAAFAAISVAPALAQSDLITADPDVVLKALTAQGYAGKLEKLDSGRPSISVKISGLNTYMDFYGCDDDFKDCKTILLAVAINLDDGTTPGKVNEWNSNQIWGRVYLDDSSDPTLDYTVSLFDGFSPAVFEETVRQWDATIGDFADFFDFK